MRVMTTLAVLALAALALALPASAAAGPGTVEVIATGLHDPRGIDADDGHRGDRLLVAESGAAKLTEILAPAHGDATARLFATLPDGASPNDVLGKGSHGAFTTLADPLSQLLRVKREDDASLVADIGEYQQTDPDPADEENNPTESNPFGLARARHGLLVTDAAGNDLLKVRKNGSIETVARFPTRTVPFPDLPGEPPPGVPPPPPPGTPIPSEAVPTGVAVGPDGAWYVSELRGFPFNKGTSRIWRIEPGTEEAECDPDAEHGPCTVYADGFTSVIDIAFEGDTLYVLEIVKEGLLLAEAEVIDPIGALWKVDDGDKTELAEGELLAPGGLAIADDERIYVTTGTFLGTNQQGIPLGEVVRIGVREDDDDDDHGKGRDKGDDDDRDKDDRGNGKGHRGDDEDDDDRDEKEHKSKKHDRDDD